MSFSLGRLRKTQHSGHLKRFSINAWPDRISICPVAILQAYVDSTAQFWCPSNANFLLTGSTKPHRPVTSSTISRWIKDLLRKAGVNTRIFAAHFVRGAAASKASQAGCSVQAILNHGRWASESTFAKFYLRETVVDSRDEIAASVMSREVITVDKSYPDPFTLISVYLALKTHSNCQTIQGQLKVVRVSLRMKNNVDCHWWV